MDRAVRRARPPELADDARFAVADLRHENREELEALLAPRFLEKTQLTWSNALDDAGVPNEIPIDTKAGDLVLFDADNERLGLVAEYEHPIMGTMRQFGELIQFSDAPATSTRHRRASARTPARSSSGSATTTTRGSTR